MTLQLGSDYIEDKHCPKSPGWSYSSTGGLHRLKCKSRQCEHCGAYWAWKWRQALKEKAEYDTALGIPAAKLALTLTFAEDVHFTTCYNALRYFWQLLRKSVREVEYWGCVEYNQAHTQPHLHFVLANTSFIDYKFIRACWLKAQAQAKIGRPAFIVNIEQIRGNILEYFTKYITKLTDGKDEIPRREKWGGRYVRYSRHFFPVGVPTMAVYASWKRQLSAQLFDAKIYSLSIYNDKSATLLDVPDFVMRSKVDQARTNTSINREWDYKSEKQRARVLTDLQMSLPAYQDRTTSVKFDKQGYTDAIAAISLRLDLTSRGTIGA